MWALRDCTPVGLLLIRFLIAVVVAEVITFTTRRRRGARFRQGLLGEIRRALPAGFLLAGVLLPQTIGLLSTSASKSGFLTVLYVVLVPLLGRLIFKKALSLEVVLYGLLALLGALLLTGAELGGLNVGDAWTVGCAVMAALHILYVERVSSRIEDALRFNTLQTSFCVLALVPFWLVEGAVVPTRLSALTIGSLLMLSLGSTLVGFTIQIRTQRILDSTTASMLFLLESPFALFFGAVFLGDRLSLTQAAGAAIILAAAVLTVRRSSGVSQEPDDNLHVA